ncbi:MAG: alpha/beta hydrolase, partial [Acidimicrobiia bacterium]
MEEGVLSLADGRNLAYTMWGAPSAHAIFYCHGFPTNRRELDLLQPRLEQLGVGARVVALNRPGYGASTFQANRSILDWPGDVAQAADQFGIGHFSVLGVSGGSPYAFACAHQLGDRVAKVGIVAGIGPMEANGMKQAAAITGPSPR